MDEWRKVLGGMTGRQIEHGLECWKNEWPPSAPEFRDCCLGKKHGSNEFGMDHIPEYHRPAAKITSRARLLSSDEREAKRALLREKIQGVKKSLQAGSGPVGPRTQEK